MSRRIVKDAVFAIPPLRKFYLKNRKALQKAEAASREFVRNAASIASIGRLRRENERLRIYARQLEHTLENAHVPPPPPEHLQRRVVSAYVDRFVISANQTLQEFDAALKGVGASLEECRTVLDFGVGCGRVLRRFKEVYPETTMVGADIDEEAIRWLRRNYGPRYGRFIVAPHAPPMNVASDRFDLIYSISVFTHLDEKMQFQWLEELHRAARPGGHLLLTVHGDYHISRVPAELQALIREKGIFYDWTTELTEGLPDFYKATYHTRDYVEREWSRYFEILAYLPRGNEGHQDLVVCRKRS